MHARSVNAMATALLLAAALAGCSSSTPPPPAAALPAATATQPADPNKNPLAGTVLEAQGDAMQKARGVQDTLQQSADQRQKEIDAQAQ